MHSIRLSLLAGAAIVAAAAGSSRPRQRPRRRRRRRRRRPKRVYTPADFARFAPKTAYDMLVQVPSFTIRTRRHERARARPGVGERADQRPADRQQIAAARSTSCSAPRPRTSSGSRSSTPPASASPGLSGQVANVILKARRKGSRASSNGTRASAPISPSRNCSAARSAIRARRARSITRCRSRTGSGPRRPRRADRDLRPQPRAHRDAATKSIIPNMSRSNIQAKFGLDGPGSSVGNLTLGYTPYWNPSISSDTRDLVTGERRAAGPTSPTLDGYYADINGDYEFALGPGRLKLIGVRHWEHEPLVTTADPDFDSSGADRPGHPLQPRHAYRRDDRPRRISLEERQERLAGLARARVQFARPEGPACSISIPTATSSRSPFPEGTGKVTEVRYEGIATLEPAADARTSTCRSRPARKSRRSTGSTTISRRANSSGPRAASRSAGARPRAGTSASSCAAGSDRSASTTSSPSRSSARTARMPATRTSSRRRAGRPRPSSRTTSATGARPGSTSIITGSRTSSTSSRSATTGRGSATCRAPTATASKAPARFSFDPIGWKGAKLDLTLGVEWTSVQAIR